LSSQRATNQEELSEPPSDADLTGSLDEVDIHEPIIADDVLVAKASETAHRAVPDRE
jgi:hypothetical protein